jgi:hypothetical protein
VSATTPEDRERFFGQSSANRVHVMEAGWLRRMRDCRLYAYRLPAGAFRPHKVGGYWVADEPVDPIEQLAGHPTRPEEGPRRREISADLPKERPQQIYPRLEPRRLVSL